MATALPAYDISDVCLNCNLFNWKQPENPTTLRKCTRCHVVAYCGKECQEEHWHKVHKKYCKYLGGLKKANHSEHRQETCKTCIASDSIGDLVFSPTNPNYVCIFEHVDWSLLPPTFPHPFPLTGPPEDRIEKMLNVAQKILLKIKMTKHPIYEIYQQEVDLMEAEMWEMKGKMYINRICGLEKVPTAVLSLINETFIKQLDRRPWIAFGCKFDNTKGQDWCKLWATFAWLIELMLSTSTLSLENNLKTKNSLPKDYMQMSKKEKFLEVADRILEALDQEVVPFSDLASIACKGKPEQKCSQCDKKIMVRGIFLYCFQGRTSTAEIVFHPTEIKRYICESSECDNKERLRNSEKISSWGTAVCSTVLRLDDTRCDNCFHLPPLNKVHRSKCRTKNYCSQVCRDADDAAHKVCCNPDKGQRRIEDRKVKIGGKDKVFAANAVTDSMAEKLSKLKVNPAFDKKVAEIIEETKKAKPTVKIDEVD